MAEEKLPKEPLISYCGICCSLCLRHTSKECPGCPELKDCKIVQCAESKKLDVVFYVKNFLVNYMKKVLIGILTSSLI